MKTSYRVDVGSLPDYEELVAEIYLDNRFVGLLSQEAGPEHTLFEIAETNGSGPMKFELEAFEKALGEAKERLKQLEKRRGVDDVDG